MGLGAPPTLHCNCARVAAGRCPFRIALHDHRHVLRSSRAIGLKAWPLGYETDHTARLQPTRMGRSEAIPRSLPRSSNNRTDKTEHDGDMQVKAELGLIPQMPDHLSSASKQARRVLYNANHSATSSCLNLAPAQPRKVRRLITLPHLPGLRSPLPRIAKQFHDSHCNDSLSLDPFRTAQNHNPRPAFIGPSLVSLFFNPGQFHPKLAS